VALASPTVTGSDRPFGIEDRICRTLSNSDSWVTVSDLAWFSGLAPHTVRRTLDVLVSTGKVQETRDHAHPHARGRMLYRLTPEGGADVPRPEEGIGGRTS
jgi:predicted ArsR family transcriptional regulator